MTHSIPRSWTDTLSDPSDRKWKYLEVNIIGLHSICEGLLLSPEDIRFTKNDLDGSYFLHSDSLMVWLGFSKNTDRPKGLPAISYTSRLLNQ